MDERTQAVLDELRHHPEGLCFNQLCARLKQKMARQTLVDRLSQLVKCGLVQRTPEKPRKGQRVLYKSTRALEDFERCIGVISYVASQQKQQMEKFIDDCEKGKVSDKTFFDEIIDRIVSLPQKVMGVAYVLAYGYDEAVAEYLLLVAFRHCNETELHIKSLLYKRAGAKKQTFRKAVLEFLERLQASHS
jgi:DNA-binding HxlR family transcriptional regulator